MNIDRLDKALSRMIDEGSINSEQGALLREAYLETPEERDSHKSIFAEIGGYLGGAFVLIATIFFTANWWDEITGGLRSLLFASLAIVLLLISYYLGSISPVRQRLSSVLALGAAISATGAVAVSRDFNDAPFFAFLTGALLASYSFYRNRHEILNIGSFGYLFITSFIAIIYFFEDDNNNGLQPVLAILWTALACTWIYLAFKNKIDKVLSYLLAVGALFLSTQFLFISGDRLISYLLAIAIVAGLARLFMAERSWPLLIGAVAITTFSMGEFVASTLGGSLGALAGLFTAGVALITSSLLALRRVQDQ